MMGHFAGGGKMLGTQMEIGPDGRISNVRG